MWRRIFTVLLVCQSVAAAARVLPDDADMAELKRVELPYVELRQGGFSWVRLLTLGLADSGSAQFRIARFTRVSDENGRFIPWGRLGVYRGRAVAFRTSGNPSDRLIRDIWILSELEAAQMQAKPNRADQAAAE